MHHGAVPTEDVTTETTRPVRRALLSQGWRDLTFLHWAVQPASVAWALPAGTVPDTLHGLTTWG